METGYALIAGAQTLDGWLQFSRVTVADGGFVKQELDRIIAQKAK